MTLSPSAELELALAKESWADPEPVDPGTAHVVRDAFRVVVDKDGALARLVDQLRS